MAHKIYSSTHGFNGYSQGCYYFIMAARLDVGPEQCLDHAFQVIFQIVLDILYIGPISRVLWVWQLAWLKKFNAFHLVKHGVVAAVDLVPSVNVSRAQKRLFPFPHKFRLVSASVGPKDPVLAHIVRVGFVPAHVISSSKHCFVVTIGRRSSTHSNLYVSAFGAFSRKWPSIIVLIVFKGWPDRRCKFLPTFSDIGEVMFVNEESVSTPAMDDTVVRTDRKRLPKPAICAAALPRLAKPERIISPVRNGDQVGGKGANNLDWCIVCILKRNVSNSTLTVFTQHIHLYIKSCTTSKAQYLFCTSSSSVWLGE